ncbi:MAG TPA: MCE family protein [Micromonosporaceae bacterium]|nr:MCE family protein [Micromonosporaceae bacterium]
MSTSAIRHRLSGRGVTGPLVKLLLFAAVTTVLTGLLAQTLGSLGIGGGPSYRARFSDVTGLLVGDDVRIAGVKVGRVERIGLVGDVAEVQFTVDRDIPLDTGVRVKVRYRNLVGQRYLALVEGPGGGRLRPGGLIPLAQTTPALDLTVLFNGFRPLFVGLSADDVNRFAYEIIQVLQGEGGTVASLLQRTASLASTLADRDAAIGRVVTNLNAVLGTLAERDAQLDETILRLQQFVSGLAADRAAILGAVDSIADLAAATGSLLRDARPDLAQDITLLNKLAGTLNDNTQVIEDTLARLPDRYAALTRTASYGSWLNFFLCDFDGRIGVPGVDTLSPTFSSDAARCGVAGIPVGGDG